MLGLQPFAPLKMLFIDPHLPEWLPQITLRQPSPWSVTATLPERLKDLLESMLPGR